MKEKINIVRILIMSSIGLLILSISCFVAMSFA